MQTKIPSTTQIRHTLKQNALLARFYRSESRRAARKAQATYNYAYRTFPGTGDHRTREAICSRAYKLFRHAEEMKVKSDSFAYDTRHALAALAFLRGKPCPGNIAKLNAKGIAAWFDTAGIFDNNASSLEAAQLCLEGHAFAAIHGRIEEMKELHKAQAALADRERLLASKKHDAAQYRKRADDAAVAAKAYADGAAMIEAEIQTRKEEIERLARKLKPKEPEGLPLGDNGTTAALEVA